MGRKKSKQSTSKPGAARIKRRAILARTAAGRAKLDTEREEIALELADYEVSCCPIGVLFEVRTGHPCTDHPGECGEITAAPGTDEEGGVSIPGASGVDLGEGATHLPTEVPTPAIVPDLQAVELEVTEVFRRPRRIPKPPPLRELVDNFKREQIANALIVERGNISRAAKRLGIMRQQLQRLLANLNVSAATYARGDDDVAAPALDRVAV